MANILFIYKNASIEADEQSFVDMYTGGGNTVTTITASAHVPGDITGFNVLVYSARIFSPTAQVPNPQLLDIPIVALHSGLASSTLLMASNIQTRLSNDVYIVDDTSPYANGNPIGLLTAFTGSVEHSLLVGAVGDVVALRDDQNAGVSAIVFADTGTIMSDASVAVNKRFYMAYQASPNNSTVNFTAAWIAIHLNAINELSQAVSLGYSGVIPTNTFVEGQSSPSFNFGTGVFTGVASYSWNAGSPTPPAWLVLSPTPDGSGQPSITFGTLAGPGTVSGLIIDGAD